MSKVSKKLEQNAGEFYFTYRVQQIIEELGNFDSSRSDELKAEFDEYIALYKLKSFNNSIYKTNTDNNVRSIVLGWVEKYGNNISIENYMKSGRAEQVKADFLLITPFDVIPISLKNYKSKKISDIQVNSGTWASSIMNLLFDSTGLGTWTYNGVTFTTKGDKNRRKIQKAINEWASDNDVLSSPFHAVVNNAFSRNDNIKHRFVKSPDTKVLTDIVQEEFSARCHEDGMLQINDMMAALKYIPRDVIRNRFMKIVGFDAQKGEELLCIWGNEYLDSITDEKFDILKSRLNDPEMKVEYVKHQKNIRLIATDNNGMILTIDIPFTYNKNGAWHDEPTPRWCQKSNAMIAPYHRRDGKALEMNTSTNTWVRLREALI